MNKYDNVIRIITTNAGLSYKQVGEMTAEEFAALIWNVLEMYNQINKR